MAGSIDPAEKLDEFLKKLDEAGMQKVVDEANAQLQAFLAAK
jgi:putative aldouronate transport system substrate-binding protein